MTTLAPDVIPECAFHPDDRDMDARHYPRNPTTEETR